MSPKHLELSRGLNKLFLKVDLLELLPSHNSNLHVLKLPMNMSQSELIRDFEIWGYEHGG